MSTDENRISHTIGSFADVPFEELPAAAQQYVLRVEELIGARVSAIGVGPGRHEIIERHSLLP